MKANSTHLATICLILAIVPTTMVGCGSADGPARSSSPESASVSPGSGPADGQTGQLVSLRIPTMHCTLSCWPKIKEELETHEGVAEVTLAQQAAEVEVDNPVVHVRTDGTFDSEKAIAALAKIGFAKATVER
jgi:periplasmic mercuric ion binding protein